MVVNDWLAKADASGDGRYRRFYEAYLAMADKAKYRPQAPSDGLGNTQLTGEELQDRGRLEREAVEYAMAFVCEDDAQTFEIGYSDFATNRALVWTIEAARAVCGGALTNRCVLELLGMAIAEIKKAVP